MKVAGANLGLGDTSSARRKKRRNARIVPITRGTWQQRRLSFFHSNVRYSASANATRTALDVTQQEVADHFAVDQGTVCNWESGKYAWRGGPDELGEYIAICQAIAAT